MAEPDQTDTLLRMVPPEMKDVDKAAALAERDAWVEAINVLIQNQREAEGQPILAEPLLAALLFHCADVVVTAHISPDDALDLFTTILTHVAAERATTPVTFIVMPTSPRLH